MRIFAANAHPILRKFCGEYATLSLHSNKKSMCHRKYWGILYKKHFVMLEKSRTFANQKLQENGNNS
jgi:hypothetical protein